MSNLIVCARCGKALKRIDELHECEERIGRPGPIKGKENLNYLLKDIDFAPLSQRPRLFPYCPFCNGESIMFTGRKFLFFKVKVGYYCFNDRCRMFQQRIVPVHPIDNIINKGSSRSKKIE